MPSSVSLYTFCKDGTRCEHASSCIENPYHEGSFYCDCPNADYNQAVAGLYCEFVATSTCNQQYSRTSFCVNGGTCGTGSEQFPGCTCPTDYVGPHCEYVGIQASGYPYDGSPAPVLNNSIHSNPGLTAGVKTLISFVVLLVVGLLAYVLYKKRGSSSSGGHVFKDSASSLHLEADGSTLHEAVQEKAIMSEAESGSSSISSYHDADDGLQENDGLQEHDGHVHHAVQLI